jgi:hypothetical protein
MEKEPINKTFADLPVFIKTHKIRLKELTKATIPTNIKDDSCLLTEAMQGVKAIDKNKKRTIMKKRDAQYFRQALQHDNPQTLLEEAIRENHRINHPVASYRVLKTKKR